MRCAARLEEPLSALLFRWGARGTASVPKGTSLQLRAYIPGLLSTAERRRLRQQCSEVARFVAPRGRPRISIGPLGAGPASAARKSEFPPMRIGRRLVVVPPWYRARSPGRLRIVIPPALAFGTGHHPTTRACLTLLERTLPVAARVLDVGTGTGILAIAAAKLAAAGVVATDNDPWAVQQARANVRRNRVAGRVTVAQCDLAPRNRGTFDLIVANIDAPTIVRLCERLPRLLREGGTLIASGFTRRDLHEVVASLHQAGLAVRERFGLHGWVALACQRAGLSRPKL